MQFGALSCFQSITKASLLKYHKFDLGLPQRQRHSTWWIYLENKLGYQKHSQANSIAGILSCSIIQHRHHRSGKVVYTRVVSKAVNNEVQAVFRSMNQFISNNMMFLFSRCDLKLGIRSSKSNCMYALSPRTLIMFGVNFSSNCFINHSHHIRGDGMYLCLSFSTATQLIYFWVLRFSLKVSLYSGIRKVNARWNAHPSFRCALFDSTHNALIERMAWRYTQSIEL